MAIQLIMVLVGSSRRAGSGDTTGQKRGMARRSKSVQAQCRHRAIGAGALVVVGLAVGLDPALRHLVAPLWSLNTVRRMRQVVKGLGAWGPILVIALMVVHSVLSRCSRMGEGNGGTLGFTPDYAETRRIFCARRG